MIIELVKMNRESKKLFLTAAVILTCLPLMCFAQGKISTDELKKIEHAVPEKATVQPKKPRKLLVFTRSDGFVHRAIPYATKALEIMGKKTGAFEVIQSSDMAVFESKSLKRFDAICFNNTTQLKFEDPKLRKNLLEFVKNGKGIVGLHAATDNFYTWPEASEMIGGQFDGHPWTADGTWKIKIYDPEHPLTAAFNDSGFEISDEIYRIKPPYFGHTYEKQRILVSLDMTDETNLLAKGVRPADKIIPISWIRSYGKGRVFYCSFGHNHHIYWNPSILQHILAGIQFALNDLVVDTTPSLEKSLDYISQYEYGHSRVPLTQLKEWVYAALDSIDTLQRIERRFLKFLQSNASLEGKRFIGRLLSVIGSEDSIPVLTEMVADSETSDMARYALERIPHASVDSALLKIIEQARGKPKIGIINTLGQRRAQMAVSTLSRLVYDSSAEIALSAVSALGQIANGQALSALAEAKKNTTGALRRQVLDAYLRCADELIARGKPYQALPVYKELFAESEPEPIRVAALRGLVQTDAKNRENIILSAIRNANSNIQSAAVALMADVPGKKITQMLSAELPNLSTELQVQVLLSFAARGDKSVLPVVSKSTKNTNESVRLAALRALGSLGDVSTVGLLIGVAASKRGAEAEAARESLSRLHSPGVDQAILDRIEKSKPDVKVEFIRITSRRNMSSAVEILLKTARGKNPKVRLESIKALKVVSTPKYLPELIDILMRSRNESERKEAEKMVSAVAHKIPQESQQADKILAVLASVEGVAARSSLYYVLGNIGASKALPVMRKGLENEDAEIQSAVIRALSIWPTPEPLADLQQIVKTPRNQLHRALALRGFINLLKIESDRSEHETVKLYQEAMNQAVNVDERKLVLSGLANVKSIAALQAVEEYLDQSALQLEAEAAVIKIANTTYKKHPQKTKIVLNRLLQITKTESVRKDALKILNRMK